MGWISKRKMATGHGLNANPQNNGSDKGPLRRVVDVVPDPQFKSLTKELLECGHLAGRTSDIFGHRPADRRRCGKCKDGKPADRSPPCTKCGGPIVHHDKPTKHGPETGWFCDTCGPRGYDA